MEMKTVEIWDSTLREGEQTPGVIFSQEQKLELAYKMFEYGVDVVSVMPEISESEQYIAKNLSNNIKTSNIVSLVRMKKKAIDLTLACDVKKIKILVPLSDIQIKTKLNIEKEKLIENVLYWIEYSKNQGAKEVGIGAEDCSRADEDFLIHFIKNIKNKIDFFYYTDTIGDLLPEEIQRIIKKIKDYYNGKIILHLHNDRGLSTVNAIYGIIAGANGISGTFTGIGERAGNIAIEEVIKTLYDKYNINSNFNIKKIDEICNLVQNYSGIFVQYHKPMCGKNIFTHKSGIHFNAIMKNPENYELFPPEEIGKKRNFVYGKYSGISNLKYLFNDKYTDSEYKIMLKLLKELSIKHKKDFTGEELIKMFGNNYLKKNNINSSLSPAR
jgi:isopropylmalate/homocitrate/citramalate synthase